MCSPVCLIFRLTAWFWFALGLLEAQNTRGMFVFLHARTLPAVAYVPFTGTEVIENTWTRSEGAPIVDGTWFHVGRDTLGRTHREGRYTLLPSDQGNPRINNIVLDDPATAIRTTLVPSRRTAILSTFFPPQASEKGVAANEQRESLGVTTLEGELVEGIRYTRSIPAGSDKPLLSNEEAWYSPQLQADVLFKQVDPRYGTWTMRLTSIQRGEPPADMFQIPAGYRIVSKQ